MHYKLACQDLHTNLPRLPFHSQLDNMSQPGFQPGQNMNSVNVHPFDLRQMSNALPTNPEQTPFETRRPSAQFNLPPSAGMMNQSILPMPQYGQQPHDPRNLARPPQHQHFAPPNMIHQAPLYQYPNRPQQPHIQTQPHLARVDPYVYGMVQQGYSPVDMRSPQQQFPIGYGPPAGYVDPSKISNGETTRWTAADVFITAEYSRHSSGPVAIPSFPRGPPRKPKQSGHALWVGNLPPAATVTDLKDHFARDATTDIQSLFLISKSNCAFVNYRSEAACVAAMNRFHDSRFHNVRLVCRLRRGSAANSNTTPSTESPKTPQESDPAAKSLSNRDKADEPSDPIIVGSSPGETGTQTTPPSATSTRVPEKYFVVKSLTLQDLEASVRNGIWATQSHNESTLNQAFNAADNVYLVFSANKSGEYFGYARMTSPITGEAVPVASTQSPQSAAPSDGPQSIPTPATETAPRGHIIDDSARGTIFWEAELSDDEEASSPNKESDDNGNSQDLGVPFKIEWISTARLPFYRTRGLRNPWNANREVKIARDGTELEPSIGKRLVQMFHRPAQMQPAGGMPPYQTG
jgi:hypothetical protein